MVARAKTKTKPRVSAAERQSLLTENLANIALEVGAHWDDAIAAWGRRSTDAGIRLAIIGACERAAEDLTTLEVQAGPDFWCSRDWIETVERIAALIVGGKARFDVATCVVQ